MLGHEEAVAQRNPIIRFARGINDDMVTNGFWPENKDERNYAEAVALTLGEICVEGRDAIDEGIPLDKKDSVVEEVADAAIRHLDLVAGRGYVIEFAWALQHLIEADCPPDHVSIEDLLEFFAYKADETDKRLGSLQRLNTYDLDFYDHFCTKYICYPLLRSVELLRRSGNMLGAGFVGENAKAFMGIMRLGAALPGFLERLLAKVEYNKTRSYRHGKKF